MGASIVRAARKEGFNRRIMSCMGKKTCPFEGDFTGLLSIFSSGGDE
jgi:hypothetical protein